MLSAAPRGLTLAEVARACDLNRSTARRILHTLVSQNFATTDDKRFLPSTRILSLARSIVQQNGIWGIATRRIQAISRRFNVTASAAILDGIDVVYVARVLATRRVMTADLSVGTRLPAWATSMGRVLLANLEPERVRDILSQSTMRQLTPHTITDPEAIILRLQNAREQGYAIVDQELEMGLRSLAVPLKREDGTVIAAINVATSASLTSLQEMLSDILPVLREAAKDIEAGLDFI